MTKENIGFTRVDSPYRITEAPLGWEKQFVEKNEALLLNAENTDFQQLLAKYWEDTTEVPVAKSKFSVMVPIHNEEKSLASSARALLLSFVPDDVEMNVDFILNACTDRSEEIIFEILGTVGDVTQKHFSEEEMLVFGDEGLDQTYLEVQRGAGIFRVHKTETKGKANALRLGNKAAVLRAHDILISIDANNYVEPDTLALMFKDSYFHLVAKKDATRVLSAITQKIHRTEPGSLEKFLRNHGVWDGAKYISVHGQCMSMDPRWACENIQPVAVEDYALGVMARSQNKEVLEVEKARIWGYRTNLMDNLKQFSRSIRGRLQLLNLHPELKPIIESDNFFMLPFSKRVAVVFNDIKTDPMHLLKYMWKFIFCELGRFIGTRDFKRDPNNQSWEELSSTK